MKNLTSIALATVAGGAFGSLPLGRIQGPAKVAYIVVPGVIGAGVAWLSPEDERVATRARVATIVGGSVMGGQALSITLDRATTAWLARQGVTRPRVVMAALAAAAAGVGQYGEGRRGYRPSAREGRPCES